MHRVKHEYLSESESLARERRATEKHEYADGQVHAMSGASIRHNRSAQGLRCAPQTLEAVNTGLAFDPPSLREPGPEYEPR